VRVHHYANAPPNVPLLPAAAAAAIEELRAAAAAAEEASRKLARRPAEQGKLLAALRDLATERDRLETGSDERGRAITTLHHLRAKVG
jgi:hypothetical protein